MGSEKSTAPGRKIRATFFRASGPLGNKPFSQWLKEIPPLRGFDSITLDLLVRQYGPQPAFGVGDVQAFATAVVLDLIMIDLSDREILRLRV